MVKLYFVFFVLLLSFQTALVSAETIWCNFLKIGCTTPQEKAEAMRFCKAIAQDLYIEALAEAQRDPTVWQFGGYNSAYDYAARRSRSILDICIKKSPELRN